MAALGKIIDFIFKIAEILIFILFAVLSVLVFWQVVNRYFLNQSLTWSEEIARYLMIWVALLGSAVIYRHNGHMAVSNVVDALHGVAKNVIKGLSLAFQIVFIVIMIWGTYQYFPTALSQKSPANQINMGLVYSIFFISAFLMILALIDIWVIHRGNIETESEEDALLKQMEEELAAEAALEAAKKGEDK